MDEKKVLRCGVWDDISLAQAQQVIQLLKVKKPEIDYQTVSVSSDDAADKVSCMEQAMMDEKIEFTVYSGEEVPIEMPDGFVIAAVTERGDRTDMLLSLPGRFLRKDDCTGLVIGSASERQRVLCEGSFPNCKAVLPEGSLTDQIQQLRDGKMDAMVVSAAAINTLRPDLSGLFIDKLDPNDFIPSAGQGLLAVEVRRRTDAVMICRSINHPGTQSLYDTEREFMRLLKADNKEAVGVCADYASDGSLSISAFYKKPTIYKVEPDMRHRKEALTELANFLREE